MSNDALEMVLGKLEGVRSVGSGRWIARCPAHEDRKASLSVAVGKEQPVLVACYAACPTPDVLAAIGLTMADISRPQEDRAERDPLVATYRYTDERGELLFEVLRTAGKRFLQRRPDGRGGWEWKLGDTRRVPYHLPELIAAVKARQPIYVCEGEKDVHALEAAGAAATCNPGGAGKWRPEYARYFRGAKQVVIVADKDEPGRRHAAAVHAALNPVVPGFAIVEAAEGKDAADHLAAGHGLTDFRPLRLADLTATKEHEITKEPPSAPLVVATKEHEITKEVPDVPVAEPAIYAGILGDITLAAEPTTEADPVGILGSLLTIVSVDIGPSPHVQVGNDRHPLLVWTLLFGRTGSGRKGGATQTAALFGKAACPDYAAYTTSGLSSGEGLIERVRDGDDGKDEGVADKRLLAIETEFGTVMTRAAREGSTLAEVCRQAWNGDPLSVLNRRRYSASWSHIGIIGHIPPKEFRRRVAAADMAGGTYNRYLPLYVERSKRLPIPEGVDSATVARLGGELGRRLAAAHGVTRLQMDAEATRLWCDELYDEFTAADDEEAAWAEFMRRAAPYCLRVAGIYAVLDGSKLIGKGHLAAAGALVRYSAASARYVLGGQLRDPRMDRLIREITAAGEAGMTRTDISNLFGRNLPKALLDELLADLLDRGGFEVLQVQTGGRPSQAYRRRLSS